MIYLMDTHVPTFRRMVPILYVRDLQAETAFYQALGLQITYQGDDFPGFIAIGCEQLEFGLETKPDFDPDSVSKVLAWQFEVDSLLPFVQLAERKRWDYQAPSCYWQAEDQWSMSIRTPNGYQLGVEGPNPNA